MKTTQLTMPVIMLAFFSMLATVGCTSTDVMDPSDNTEKGTTITLNVASPDAYVFSPTRAESHVGHQLRYVAKLFKNDKYSGEQFIERKEILASDVTNMIIFQQPAADYIVRIFADYVDSEATANDNGEYPDKYYDTSSKDGKIKMKAIQNETGNTVYPSKININNDDYDCFAIEHTFTKTALIYEQSLTLKRAVSKVRIINNGGNPAGVEKINITNFSYLNEYDFTSRKSATHIDVSQANLKQSPIEFTPTNLSQNELFYFYTFGYYAAEINTISFDIIGKDNYEYAPVKIDGGVLKPVANYILNVKGNFLTPTTSPSNAINLTVSTDDNWDSPDNEYDVKTN